MKTACACLHCGQELSTGQEDFCCAGCSVVYQILHTNGLEKFYQLKPRKILPSINYFNRQHPLDWLDQYPGLKTGRLELGIEGIQCAACVWAILHLSRKYGPVKVSVDVGLGRLCLEFNPASFDLRNCLQKIQQLGYRILPFKAESKNESASLLTRLGVCVAIAMNTMFLSFSHYLGLNTSEPELFYLFARLNFYLSFVAVIVGGSYFFHRAIISVRNGLLHFDIPVALGILAAFVGSSYSYWHHRWGDVYFDTLNIFIALMLGGRFLQQRVIDYNRNILINEDDLGRMKIKKVGEHLQDILFSEVKAGDQLLLQPGVLVPVDSKLLTERADFSLSSISGESLPVSYYEDQIIPSGAILSGSTAVKIESITDYNQSLLSKLMPEPRLNDSLPVTWQWVTKKYVLLVSGLALFGFLIWQIKDPHRSLSVLIAILVVTCPCSLGIAIPLARSIAIKSLLKKGVFIRSGDLLDQCLQLKKIVFDKTGTLTLSTLSVLNPEILNQLTLKERAILFNMAAQSAHPASHAVYQYLVSKKMPYLELNIHERTGQGLEAEANGSVYHLGRFSDPPPQEAQFLSSQPYSVDFIRDGITRAHIELAESELAESELADTKEVLHQLHGMGLELYLISGDKEGRVYTMAQKWGLTRAHVRAEQNPLQKEVFIQNLNQQDTLMLGDGLNDSLALKKALISGVPLGDNSMMAHAGDFYYVSAGLGWLVLLLKTSIKLKKTINTNLCFSLIYNLSVVGLALAGWMSPLLCALVMPLGSVGIISYSVSQMRQGA